MWKFEHTILTQDATPEQIWTVWSDVENWNQWDAQIEWSSCDEQFQKGSTIMLKPLNGPKTKGKITLCEVNHRFTVTSSLGLGTQIEIAHTVERQDNEIKLTHQASISGPLSNMLSKVVGTKIAESLPNAMKNLIQIASQQS